MNDNEITIAQQAAACLTWFESGERISTDTKRNVRCLANGKPEVVQDLCREAHGDGDSAGPMLPDDWRYEFIEEALEAIAEERDGEDAEPSIYNHELLAWLSSHGWRPGYCDEAAREFGDTEGERNGVPPGLRPDTMARIARGQWYEMRLVADRVRTLLEACEDVIPSRVASGDSEATV